MANGRSQLDISYYFSGFQAQIAVHAKNILIFGNFLLTDSSKLSMNLKACSHGGAVEDFFFLPTVRSFTRELGESILATPSEFSVNALFIRRTGANGKEVNLSWHARGIEVLDRRSCFVMEGQYFCEALCSRMSGAEAKYCSCLAPPRSLMY